MDGKNSIIPGCGYHHVAIRAADFDGTLRFYTEGLGFRVQRQDERARDDRDQAGEGECGVPQRWRNLEPCHRATCLPGPGVGSAQPDRESPRPAKKSGSGIACSRRESRRG